MNNCKLCDRETTVFFNILLNKVSICDSCATAITLQNVNHVFMERASK